MRSMKPTTSLPIPAALHFSSLTLSRPLRALKSLGEGSVVLQLLAPAISNILTGIAIR